MLDGAHTAKTILADRAASEASASAQDTLAPGHAAPAGGSEPTGRAARAVSDGWFSHRLRRWLGGKPKPPAPAEPEVAPALTDPLRELFESAGPAVVSVALDGRLTYVNPSAERMIGYHAEELMREWVTVDILGPGEGVRLVAEIQKICGVDRPIAPTSAGRMAAYMECVSTLPPSRVPSFNVQLRRKDGELIPVTLHMSALRDKDGAVAGLVAIAVDHAATLRQDQALRESQERYRDLFENSTEMIATLSPAGKFLYANPAWKRCFGKSVDELLEIESFEDLFGFSCRADVGILFRRALDGESIERAPLRYHTSDGLVRELELSLSQRQKAGNPLAVRCLMRDVTQQRQREHRLALQLVVSQIVGENASTDVAGMRILEALCVSQGWDMAVHWGVNQEEKRLEFRSAWAAPGRRAESFIEDSMGLTLNGSLNGGAQAAAQAQDWTFPSAPGRRPSRCGSPTWPPSRRRPALSLPWSTRWSAAGPSRCARETRCLPCLSSTATSA